MTAMKRSLNIRSDTGLTLVELTAYVVMLGIVMSTVVGLYISINNAQKTVTAVVNASNTGQAAATQIERAINNASAIAITAPRTGDQLMLLRTASPTTPVTWACEAWYFQSAANAPNGIGNIRYTTSNTAIATPSANQLSTWTSIATGVTPVGRSTIFIGPTFANSTVIVSVEFEIAKSGEKPQLISTSVTTPLGNTGGSPCL